MAKQSAAGSRNAQAERLSFEDVERLCRHLHVHCSHWFLKEKFKRADRDNSGYLNFEEFGVFVRLLKEREEIKEIWEGLVRDPLAGMDRSEFRRFLQDVQKVDVEVDKVQVDKVFRKFCRQSAKMELAHGNPQQQLTQENPDMRMNRETFTSFLLSSSYNPPLLTTVNKVLDRPLNEYYCSSSHNTYLMGRQVAGESSVEGYIRVLQRGCRCVEIDCWDGDDGRPVVTHGRTGTTACLFSDVISTIGKYAFIASPYPVTLSLEVHCSLEQQVKMADILVNILGERLITEPFMTNSMILPSPQELKHRILVKVKGSGPEGLTLQDRDADAMERSGLSGKNFAFGRSGSSSGAFGGGRSSSRSSLRLSDASRSGVTSSSSSSSSALPSMRSASSDSGLKSLRCSSISVDAAPSSSFPFSLNQNRRSVLSSRASVWPACAGLSSTVSSSGDFVTSSFPCTGSTATGRVTSSPVPGLQ